MVEDYLTVGRRAVLCVLIALLTHICPLVCNLQGTLFIIIHRCLVYFEDFNENSRCVFENFLTFSFTDVIDKIRNIFANRSLVNITLIISGKAHFLTLRLLMSYIYIYIYMEHLFLMFLDHTQRRTTVGRTPLDE